MHCYSCERAFVHLMFSIDNDCTNNQDDPSVSFLRVKILEQYFQYIIVFILFYLLKLLNRNVPNCPYLLIIILCT